MLGYLSASWSWVSRPFPRFGKSQSAIIYLIKIFICVSFPSATPVIKLFLLIIFYRSHRFLHSFFLFFFFYSFFDWIITKVLFSYLRFFLLIYQICCWCFLMHFSPHLINCILELQHFCLVLYVCVCDFFFCVKFLIFCVSYFPNCIILSFCVLFFCSSVSFLKMAILNSWLGKSQISVFGVGYWKIIVIFVGVLFPYFFIFL